MRDVELVVLLVAGIAIVVTGCVQARRRRRAVAEEELGYLRGVVSSAVPLPGEQVRSAVAGRLAGRTAGAELVTDALAAGSLPRQLLVVRFPTRSARPWRLEAVRPHPRGALFAGTLPDAPEVAAADRWGADVVVRAVGEDRVPAAIWPPLARLVADGRVRQLLVRPDGVRLVYEVGVARRDAYRITRKVEIERIPADTETLRATIAGAAGLAEVLDGAGEDALRTAVGG